MSTKANLKPFHHWNSIQTKPQIGWHFVIFEQWEGKECSLAWQKATWLRARWYITQLLFIVPSEITTKRGVLDLIEIAEVGFLYMLICIKCMDAKGTLSMDLHNFQTNLSLDILTTESIDVINMLNFVHGLPLGFYPELQVYIDIIHQWLSIIYLWETPWHTHSHAVCCLLYNHLG